MLAADGGVSRCPVTEVQRSSELWHRRRPVSVAAVAQLPTLTSSSQSRLCEKAIFATTVRRDDASDRLGIDDRDLGSGARTPETTRRTSFRTAAVWSRDPGCGRPVCSVRSPSPGPNSRAASRHLTFKVVGLCVNVS